MVTGGAGFLGINLIRYLLSRGHRITSYDLAPFDYEDCRSRIREVRGDIRDRDAVREAVKGVQIVVHCAAALPLYTLSALLGMQAHAGPRAKAIIVRKGERRFAFEVDKVVSQQEVVVRPLRDEPAFVQHQDAACVAANLHCTRRPGTCEPSRSAGVACEPGSVCRC